MTSKADLEKLREVAEAATPGPWVENGAIFKLPRGSEPWPMVRNTGTENVAAVIHEQDVTYLSTFSPAAVLALLDRLEDAEAAEKQLRRALVPFPHPDDGACPTWYDGCHCTMETMLHNIKRADDAVETAQEPFLAILRSELRWLQDNEKNCVDLYGPYGDRTRMARAAVSALTATLKRIGKEPE